MWYHVNLTHSCCFLLTLTQPTCESNEVYQTILANLVYQAILGEPSVPSDPKDPRVPSVPNDPRLPVYFRSTGRNKVGMKVGQFCR